MVNDLSFKTTKVFSHVYSTPDKSRDRFELILVETLRSLEENGIKFVLKAKQTKAIEQLYEKRIF